MTDRKPDTAAPESKKNAPILVAVDFTPDSEAALLWACDYARVMGAPVLVLHVVHDPSDAPGYYKAKDEDRLRPFEEIAAEMMQRFLAEHQAQRPNDAVLKAAESILVHGIPATRILEVASARGARLVVMGSRGHTGLPHLLLGSKAERVAQLSPVPVTIVKARKNGG